MSMRVALRRLQLAVQEEMVRSWRRNTSDLVHFLHSAVIPIALAFTHNHPKPQAGTISQLLSLGSNLDESFKAPSLPANLISSISTHYQAGCEQGVVSISILDFSPLFLPLWVRYLTKDDFCSPCQLSQCSALSARLITHPLATSSRALCAIFPRSKPLCASSSLR